MSQEQISRRLQTLNRLALAAARDKDKSAARLISRRIAALKQGSRS